MQIRIANHEDAPTIWSIIEPVIRAGETYALTPAMSKEEALDYWFGSDKTTYVAEQDGEIQGTYYNRANQSGGGSHVCNCGYMTAAHATGRGVARRMCEHSLSYARSHGYLAMQFNFVVSTNVRAIGLSLGFEIVGRLPQAFNHPSKGYVDALIMFRNI
jgi:ribosomal protein S18 acetylase RimI-like enzyme